MPESVPPAGQQPDTRSVESKQGEGASPAVQRPAAGGPPRAAAAGPARGAAGGPGERPGPNFVRIRWLEKIGGHEADEEWAEERRAYNLVGSGHAELVEDDEKK